jgi:lysophospholipase L1-like esterase
MKRSYCRLLSLLLALAVAWSGSTAEAQTPVGAGDRVAIVGDSITEQKLYSKYMECYLLACSGIPDLQVMQFGWSGEQAAGFAARLENDLQYFRPTVVTLCYGMNDGRYQPYNEEIGSNYENNMRNVLKKLEAFGVTTIVVGSPGAVDTDFFRPGQMMGDRPAHVAYNDNLAHLRDIDKKLASEAKQRFADVHAAMYDTMEKAKEERGNKYDVCGGDGFHPGPNGQLVMAYAFLKGLGLDGNIGEVTIDLQGQTAASPGHKVLAGQAGKVELESTRWPFCFEGDGKSSNSTRSIVPYLPFNADLNRLTLKVKGLTANQAKVTWGSESKQFSQEQLTRGINLTAEFTTTPFDDAFQKLQQAVANKQNYETFMIKQIVTNFRQIPGLNDDAELREATRTIGKKLFARQEQLAAEARAQLVPVKHTLTVTELP